MLMARAGKRAREPPACLHRWSPPPNAWGISPSPPPATQAGVTHRKYRDGGHLRPVARSLARRRSASTSAV